MTAVEKDLVAELIKAANDVHNAAKEMKNSKDTARKISKISLEISTSVDNTTTAARLRGETTDLEISVAAALGATKDVFTQCVTFMIDASHKGAVTRYFGKSVTADTTSGYLASVEGLRELLKIRDSKCKLMIEPFAGLGIRVDQSKDDLCLNITNLDAAYDGLKTTLNVMVNITDGLDWPLKAAPQTFLYILQLLEDWQDVPPKATALLSSVQRLWNIVGQISSDKTAVTPQLRSHLSDFFETLQRVAIRLHIVLHTGNFKRAMAIHTVSACLELVEKRLDEARNTISLALQVDDHALVAKIDKKLDDMNAKLDQRQVPVRPAPTLQFGSAILYSMLPPKPIVFHGREGIIDDIVDHLTRPGTARIAILGAGGMGKPR